MKYRSLMTVVGVVCGLTLLIVAACDGPLSTDPDPADGDTEAQPTSEEVFAELLNLIEGIDFDAEEPVEEIRALEGEIQEIRDGFETVLQLEPNDPLANVGVAVLIMVQRAYADPFDHFLSAELWSELDAMPDDPAPSYVLDLLWPESVRTIGAIQDELATIGDALADAGSHLAVAVEHFDAPIEIEIVIDDGNQESVRMVLDKPEIEVFQASAAAARVPIIMAQVYDLEVYDDDGDPLDLPKFIGQIIEWAMEEKWDQTNDELINRALHALRCDSFLTRRAGGPSLDDARTVLVEALNAAKSAHEGLMARDFGADDYLIPGEELPEDLLEEMNHGLEDLGISREITGLADLADLLIDLVNGDEVLTNEAMWPDLDDKLEISIGAFFDYDGDARAWLPEQSHFDQIAETQDYQDIGDQLGAVFEDENNWPDLSFGGIFDPEIELPEA